MSAAEKPIQASVAGGDNQSAGEEWLTLEECAAWLRLTPDKVSLLSKGPEPVIPGCWFNLRLVRFHKPTVIAQLTDPERALKALEARSRSRRRRKPARR